MTSQDRFGIVIEEHSNNVWGWNGRLIDRQTKTRYPLLKTVVDYELQGEVGYATCAFDTKDELVAAAKRKARNILRMGA